MKKIIAFLIMFNLGSSLLHAQPPVRLGRQAIKATVTKTPVTPAVKIPGTTLPNSSLVPSIGVTHLPGYKRPWLEQQKRDLKAWQIKRQRRHDQLQILNKAAAERAYQMALAALPSLQQGMAFKVTNFSNYISQLEKLPAVPAPFAANPGHIAYRGLALDADGTSLSNILKNGLRVQDVGKENNTLNLAYASYGGYGAMKYITGHPVTNLTHDPQAAVNWGSKRLTPSLPVLTLVKVRGKFAGKSIETVAEDIPASQIEEVAVFLNIRGYSTWCKVELNKNNTFTLTPYGPPSPQNK